MGIIEGLFELCMVWMLHYTWATCSYCQCIFIGVMFAMNTFSTIGYGEDKPIGDNKRASGRKINRRVQFSVSKK